MAFPRFVIGSGNGESGKNSRRICRQPMKAERLNEKEEKPCDLMAYVPIVWLNWVSVSHEYQRLWIRRCDRSYCLLTHFSEQERKEMERSCKGLFLYGINDDFLTLYLENAQGDLFQFNNGDILHD